MNAQRILFSPDSRLEDISHAPVCKEKIFKNFLDGYLQYST